MGVAMSVHAQSLSPSTLNATGGMKIIGSSEFEWSVGEMTMVSTFTASNVVVTQGVLQPSDAMTAVPHVAALASMLQVFPNPASSVVNLRYAAPYAGVLEYRLVDQMGRVLDYKSIGVKQGINDQQVDLEGLACTSYILEITTHTPGAETVSFKIQKIK